MDYKITKLAFSTFFFYDISHESCKFEKFDCELLEKRNANINL